MNDASTDITTDGQIKNSLVEKPEVSTDSKQSSEGMKATYNGPSSSEKDKYRFLIGDTDMRFPLLFDDEIQFVIDDNKIHNKRMYILYSNVCNKFMKMPKRSLGPQSEDYSETIKQYSKLADSYKKLLAASAVPFIDYTNVVEPIFYKGMHDNV